MPSEKKKSSKKKLSNDEKSKEEKVSALVSETTATDNKSELQSSNNLNSDFEAGIIFNRFDKSGQGQISADDFRKIWHEIKEKNNLFNPNEMRQSAITQTNISKDTANKTNVEKQGGLSYEAGKFDRFRDDKLDQHDFEDIVKAFPIMTNMPKISHPTKHDTFPAEIITGRLLTHYDETAGVAIPSSAVDQHREIGNKVTPLAECYKLRYERLRLLLSGRLLPRRENLLKTYRQFEDCSTEIVAARRTVEKETLVDTEQILDRLRTAESLRQSNIKQQMLQLESELEAIERVVRKVDLANEGSAHTGSSSGITLTSVGIIESHASLGLDTDSMKKHRATAMVELIQQFADISATIDRLSSKPTTMPVDLPSTEFPRELHDRIDKADQYDKCMHALDVKDQLLWEVMCDRDQMKDLLGQEKELCQKYASELADWAEMAQGLVAQMTELKVQKRAADCRVDELMQLLQDNNIIYIDDDGEEELDK